MRGIAFTANLNEDAFINRAHSIIKDYFGISGRVFERKRSEGNSLNLLVNNRILAIVFKEWVGEYCNKKHPPVWVESLTFSGQQALLSGLLDGDGSKDGRQTLELSNYSLCYLAKRLFESKHVPVSFSMSKKKRNRKQKWKIRPLKRYTHVIFGGDFVAYQVSCVKNYKYSGMVLDFEVENSHMYCSPIGIYHNSPSVDLEDVKLQYVEQAGLDHHDFDLWSQRKRALSRKPYINPSLIGEMSEASQYENSWKVAQNSQVLAKMFAEHRAEIIMSKLDADTGGDRYNIHIQDGREDLINKAYKQLGI
jgi:hypothetical protein